MPVQTLESGADRPHASGLRELEDFENVLAEPEQEIASVCVLYAARLRRPATGGPGACFLASSSVIT